MDHSDHVFLLSKGIPISDGTWADFGSGSGAFTLALAELIGPTGSIYSIDKNPGALRDQERALLSRFADRIPDMHYLVADFIRPLELPSLDGAVLANSLHFLRQKEIFLRLVGTYLRPGGRLILVEYNVDRGNPWVPYPLSYSTWESIAQQVGFVNTSLLASRPSRFLGEIYSALSFKSNG